MKNVKLSIILPVHNGADVIQDCLHSLFDQDGWKVAHDYEVIVVDDGSTDSTAQIAEQFSVKVVKHTNNRGRSAARQTGAQYAQSENLLFVDSRVRLAPDFLQQLSWYFPMYPVVLGGGYKPTTESRGLTRVFFLIRRYWYGTHQFPQAKMDYFISSSNFRRAPKGTSGLAITQDLWQKIQMPDDHMANDDTALFHKLITEQRTPILRVKSLHWQYIARQNLWETLTWLRHRGHTFADFYLSGPGFLLALMATLILAWLFPILTLFVIATLLVTVSLVLAAKPTDASLILGTSPLLLTPFLVGILEYYWQKHRRFIQLIIVSIFFVVLLAYFWNHREDWEIFRQLSITEIGVITLLYILFYISNGIFLWFLLPLFNASIKLQEGFALAVITALGNLILPFRGGAGLRAWYLNRYHALSLPTFLSSLSANYLLAFNISALAAVFTILLAHPLTWPIWSLMLLFTGIWMTTGLLILHPWINQLPTWLPLRTKLEQALRGLATLRKSRLLLAQLAGITLLNVVLGSTILWLEFRSLGIVTQSGTAVSWGETLLLANVSSLSLFVSITPSALGIREGMLMLTGQLLAIDSGKTLAVAILDRGMNALTLLALTPLTLKLLAHRKQN
jgi:glycosyltransferase involved in cell wall biosynthesis